MRLKEKLMRIFGYEYIDNITINKRWTEPRDIKLIQKALYHLQFGKYESEIIIRKKDNMLIDGYTTYILEKTQGKKIVKVKRV